jgi:hypothetical protein
MKIYGVEPLKCRPKMLKLEIRFALSKSGEQLVSIDFTNV